MSGLDDLQADLDEIARELDRVECLHVGQRALALMNAADRLRNLLTDRDLDVPPLTSEIIAWLEADPEHVVKTWRSDCGAWAEVIMPGVAIWRSRLAEFDDQRQYGYRLGTREPATERVRLDQLPGRTLPGHVCPVNHFRWVYGAQRFEWTIHGATWQLLDIAPDGTVEVLKDSAS